MWPSLLSRTPTRMIVLAEYQALPPRDWNRRMREHKPNLLENSILFMIFKEKQNTNPPIFTSLKEDNDDHVCQAGGEASGQNLLLIEEIHIDIVFRIVLEQWQMHVLMITTK